MRAAAERGLALSAAAYVDALDALAAEADVTTAWGDYDALIVPTAAAPAWCAEDEAPPGLTLRRRACLAPGSTPPGCLASASQASRIRMDGRSACRSSRRSGMTMLC